MSDSLSKLIIKLLNQWSSGWVPLEVLFAAVKTFDVNIDNIGNFVLIVKNSIDTGASNTVQRWIERRRRKRNVADWRLFWRTGSGEVLLLICWNYELKMNIF